MANGCDVSDSEAPLDETVCEVVFGVTELDEHDEIDTMKSAVVKREIFAFRLTIAISIY